jgi:hypothetical protein
LNPAPNGDITHKIPFFCPYALDVLRTNRLMSQIHYYLIPNSSGAEEHWKLYRKLGFRNAQAG